LACSISLNLLANVPSDEQQLVDSEIVHCGSSLMTFLLTDTTDTADIRDIVADFEAIR